MNLSVFDDVSQDRELVGSSVLTAPTCDSNNKTPTSNPIIPVEGFGEDLSVGKLLKNSFSKDSHATVTSQNVISFADMVKCELQDKQKMIDGLLDEVKEKGAAIEICGKDIRKLREEKLLLENRYKDLSAKCDQIKVWNDAVLKVIQNWNNNTSTLLICDDVIYNEIFQSLDTLKGKYQDLQNLNNQLQVTVKSKDVELEQLRPIKQLHGNLENSHQQTLQYLKLMKAEIGKLENYRMTIHTQEKVIAKLQSVVESKLKSKFAFLKNISTTIATPDIVKGEDKERQVSLATDNNVDEPFLRMQKENDELLEKIKLLEQTILELQAPPTKLNIEVTSRPSPHESRLSTPDLSQDDSHFDGQIPANYSNVKKANLRIDQLIAENVSKQFRIEALENQLESSSRESAREIARLRTKLFELEISLSLANVDPLPTKPTEEIEIIPVPPQEPSMTVDDLQPDILGNISPRNRVATLILPPKSIEIEQEIAPTIDDLLKTPKGGERTRADSGFDIDRIPTPDELRDNPKSVNATTNKSPPKSLSTKKRREIIKEGMVERTFALYEDGDNYSLQNPTVMGEATIQFKYVHEKQQKKHVFTMTRIKVENYPMDELKAKIEIFVIVSVINDRGKSIWTIETPPVRDPGSMVQWDHDPTQAVDDKKFSVSAADFFNYIDSENGMKVCCTLKKKLSTDGKDQLVGVGSASLLFSG